MKNKGEIVIPIEKSADARLFLEKNLIQKEALNTLKKHVNETLNRINNTDDYPDDDPKFKKRHHDVITILGGRGSGKTTFMLNALKHYTDSPEDSPKVVNLGIIDPTLVECRESIFLNIISRIKSEVYKVDKLKKPDFRNSLNKLASGVVELNGVGTRSMDRELWDDPIYVMQEGLDKVREGESLEKDFHNFLHVALKHLGEKKEAFILAFDDIDTDFSKGWAVLEIIRKYLTSPRLIIILTGDFDLYSNIVRMQLWKHFNKDFISIETEDQTALNKFTQRINSLENQYLLKILKPSRRIELKTLSAITAQHNILVDYEDENNQEKGEEKSQHNLWDELEEMLRKSYSLTPSSGLTEAMAYIQRQPVRTIIQMLRSIKDSRKDADNPYALHDCMVRLFATHLSHLGFRWPEDILTTRKRYGMNQLLQRLMDNKILHKAAHLPCTQENNDSNSSALVLSGHYATAISRHPNLLCDYFIKVLLTRDFITPNNIHTHNYIDKMGLDMDELSLNTARKYTAAYLQWFKIPNTPLNKGLLRLSEDSTRKRTPADLARTLWGIDVPSRQLTNELLEVKETLDYALLSDDLFADIRPFIERIQHMQDSNSVNTHYKNNIKELLFNSPRSLSTYITSWHKQLLNMLLNGAMSLGRQEFNYLSAYQLVAVIGLLAELSKEEIELELNRYSAPRITKSRSFSDMESHVSSVTFADDTHEQSLNNPGEFLNSVETWKKENTGIIPVPPKTLAAIWDRFNNYLEIMEKEKNVLYAGAVLYRFAIALLNAVLIEEALHHAPQIRLNPSFAETPIETFISNIKTAKNDKEYGKLTYFKWMLGCPIWALLFPPESETMSQHLKELKQDGIPIYAKVSFAGTTLTNSYHLLNSLMIPHDNSSAGRWRWAMPAKLGKLPPTRNNIDELITYLKPIDELPPEYIDSIINPVRRKLDDAVIRDTVRNLFKNVNIRSMLESSMKTLYRELAEDIVSCTVESDHGQAFLWALLDYNPVETDPIFP